MKYRLLISFAIFCLFPTFVPANAQSNLKSAPILRLLSFVPDAPKFRQYLSYGDLDAWYAGWAIPRIKDRKEWLQLNDQRVNYIPLWNIIMPRQTVLPEILGSNFLNADDMAAFYGFSVFNANRWLQAGQPPDLITAVDITDNPSQVATALTNAGYTTEKLSNDATLYSLRKDYELDLNNTKIPHVGMLPGLNRIALNDKTLIISAATNNISDAWQAHTSNTSLKENSTYVAAIKALDDPALAKMGQLVGVILMDSSTLRTANSCPPRISKETCQTLMKRLVGTEEPSQSLPDYNLAAFATFHEAGATHLVLTLVFPKGTATNGVADALKARLQNYVSVVTRQPFLERLHKFGGDLDFAVSSEANKLPVVIVGLHQPDPREPNASNSVRPAVVNWADMVNQRDLLFLFRTPSDVAK